MPKSINLLFGVHNHQPVGNFAHVFARATATCYRPFIETLYNFPEIKSTIHFSGALLDWLLGHDRGLLQMLAEMVRRGQVELLSGGYYEPILSLIPERDRLGQIKLLNDFIQDYFQFQPQGMWVSERVWEPQLVKTLVKAGIKYVLLDDFHFLRAGLKAENLFGYYLTEEEGETVAVFPISKRLRYMIPFSSPTQPISYLQSLASEQTARVVTIVDDGEKFGLWPGTQQWVWQERWLERFFQLLITNQDWLKTETVSQYMQRHPARGLCFLSCTSYEEMMSWCGGFFRNFLTRYPEANNLHKRMLYVSEKIEAAGRTNKQLAQQAKRFLYMAQCNCPYWHGVFGGIYLKHLRSTAYKNLISAQTLIEQREKSQPIETEVFDFDKDGQDEIIIKNAFLNVFISPAKGGGIFELDYLPQSINLVDGMTRREEAYHPQIKSKAKRAFTLKKRKVRSIHDLLDSKEKGLENFLLYDTYRRSSLLDHFFTLDVTFSAFKNLRYIERGDFVLGSYSFALEKRAHTVTVTLQRDAPVDFKGQQIPLTITKKLSFNNRAAQIAIEYTLEAFTYKTLDILFGLEFNLSCSDTKQPNILRCRGNTGQKVYNLAEDVIAREINQVQLEDVHRGVEIVLHFNGRPHVWAYPLETVSCSEEGFERNYQQTVLMPHWRLKLAKCWQTRLTLGINQK